MAGWKFTYEGTEYLSVDLTLGGAEKVEELAGTTWLAFNPYRSAKQASALLAVLVAEGTGRTVEEVRGELAAMKVDDILGCLEVVEDDLPVEYRDGNPRPADAP